ncbi:hypothetical protein LXT21_17820 [Myxococcus sp. K38C18041901]|uniref:hypothetical protein n=1 Tax=Myxococcus guangdongensis TaxID=2906760 RepID=UPI0020A75FD0|nr:hypothetical protein [Myxococcus guangdongensis]MCP3060645.1 hypothetical protein [Myxococcus guangdongensis]
MQAGALFGGALLAVGLMLTGCGGPAEEEDGTEALTSREALIPNCTSSREGVIFYSSAAQTSMVGYTGCGCGRWTSWGFTTAYSAVTNQCVPPSSPES